MTTPVELGTNVGYHAGADVYCSFTEYYGDGTVYGWRHLYLPSGELVRGAGLTKRALVELGAYAEEAVCPANPVDVAVVPVDAVEPVDAPVAEPAAEAAAPVPEAAAPVPEQPKAEEPKVKPVQPPYTVKLVHPDFSVEYKNVVAVEVKDASGTLTFSVA